MQPLIRGRWVLINYTLTGMLVGAALAMGVYWVAASQRRWGPLDDGDIWIQVMQTLALVLAGGFVGFFCDVVHLSIQAWGFGDQGRLDYDDSISRYPPPGST